MNTHETTAGSEVDCASSCYAPTKSQKQMMEKTLGVGGKYYGKNNIIPDEHEMPDIEELIHYGYMKLMGINILGSKTYMVTRKGYQYIFA